MGRKISIHDRKFDGRRAVPSDRLSRLTKPGILELMEKVGGVELRNRNAGLRKHDLAAAAKRLFGGEAIVENEIKERAVRWLPAEMTFGSSEVGQPRHAKYQRLAWI